MFEAWADWWRKEILKLHEVSMGSGTCVTFGESFYTVLLQLMTLGQKLLSYSENMEQKGNQKLGERNDKK